MERKQVDARTDPARDAKRLWLYFAGLLATYGVALVVFWPGEGQGAPDTLFLAIMFAPTVGALLARFVGPGVIQWGRPNLWLLAGLVPTAVVLAAYLLMVAFGQLSVDGSRLQIALVGAPVAILVAGLSAVGEEIGWRGFLWPLLRSRWGFLATAGMMFVVWWSYHVPVILFGWYGSLGGLPAFTVGIAGFVLFTGVITDRSRSLWPSVVAHGAWNALVATSFAVDETGDFAALTGSDSLLGEFGWIAASSSLILGVFVAAWHIRSGGGSAQAELDD